MSKKTEAATADTLPPPAPEFTPVTVVIEDSDGILEKLREVGVTATRDPSPGVIVTLDHPFRVFAGDKVIVDKPGHWRVEKLNA
jgi:hypothetical protein